MKKHIIFIFVMSTLLFLIFLIIILGMANPFGLTPQPPFTNQQTAPSTFSGPTTSTLPPPLVPSPNPFLS